jgi:ubiquinone/menaquinone biosynthesis C-methylase UbiE
MKTESENILYYNAIANEYNDMLDKNQDKVVRKKVADKFCNVVKGGGVLDFGGGTGLDIQWLTDKGFTVFFCEPSSGMRERAIEDHSNLSKGKITFLNTSSTDFRQWHSQLPFVEKVDAVLSNFAVLNCIPHIELLFASLALVIKPGGNMIALVLTKKFKNNLKKNFQNMLKSFIYSGPVTLNIRHKKHGQTVYVYSIKEIKKASAKHFIFCGSEIIPASGFTLIHLKRK